MNLCRTVVSQGLTLAVVFATLTPGLAQPRVVFLGEQHTSATDHKAQLDALVRLKQQGPVVIVAEMFTERAAGELSDWNLGAGPADFGPEFWQKEWGHPQELYSPIFGWARKQKVAVQWLRPDPDHTKQVREKGPATAVARLDEVLIGPKSYRDFMAEIARSHGHADQVDDAMIDRMFTVQCYWDEFMAWRIADLAQAYPDHTLAVLVGDGHLRDGEGIPWRLRRRAPELELEVLRGGHRRD
jgi:uncharacterized iron-regulated protein